MLNNKKKKALFVISSFPGICGEQGWSRERSVHPWCYPNMPDSTPPLKVRFSIRSALSPRGGFDWCRSIQWQERNELVHHWYITPWDHSVLPYFNENVNSFRTETAIFAPYLITIDFLDSIVFWWIWRDTTPGICRSYMHNFTWFQQLGYWQESTGGCPI